MTRTSLCLLAILATSVSAQNELVTYHDLAAMPTWSLGNMKAKGAMGMFASLAVAEMPPGAQGRAGTAHHHTQEQIVVGIGGSPMGTIDGAVYRYGTYGAAFVPSDVQHSTINGLTSAPSTFIEFQPVRRADWFPPHPKTAFPQGAKPASLQNDQRVFESFEPTAGGWTLNGGTARFKTMTGQTVRFTMWDLSAADAVANLVQDIGPAERFIYVFDGQAELAIDGNRREMQTHNLAIASPGVKNIEIRSQGQGRKLVGVFDAVVR